MSLKPLRQHGPVALTIWGLLLASSIVAAILGHFSLSFVALATLGLALFPVLMARRFDIRLPLPFVLATTLFVIASIFMGEAFDFYERVWWWDVALHGASAIGFGLVGFLFVFMMFEGDRFAAPPWALCVLAFGLAVTVGVAWEVFEYIMDHSFGLHMQKSGLDDTMGDLIVDLIGAAIAAMLGYVYLRAPDRAFWSWPIRQFVAMNRKFFRKHRSDGK